MCSRCSPPSYDYKKCLLKSDPAASGVVGIPKLVCFKPVLSNTQERLQVDLAREDLEALALRLKPQQVVAVAVDDDEVETYGEGSFWLAKLISRATVLKSDLCHKGQTYESGWRVCRARWLTLKSRAADDAQGKNQVDKYHFASPDPEDFIYLNINSIVRGLKLGSMTVQSRVFMLPVKKREKIESALYAHL